MIGSSPRRLVLASLATALAIGGVFAAQSGFGRSLRAALAGQEGPLPGDAPSAGPMLAGLPLIERPAAKAGGVLAVLYSGDGGWAKAADSVAQGVARRGISTVGIDSMRYFWPGRTPEGAAADLAAVVSRYRAVWRKDQVVLVGFSFGGDALPMIVPHLPADTRSHVKALILISPTGEGSMIVRPRNWLDIRSRRDTPLGPLLASLRGGRLTCIYGSDDHVARCRQLLPPPTLVALPGGHHFGGRFDAVADAVVRAAGP
jgi:type IV secretory pathway VirJ component